jgi:hypothetical protein
MDFNTSIDLQNKPVDFLIFGKDNTTHFVANGEYMNDDGLSLNLDYNRYNLEYAGFKDGSDLSFSV